MAEKHTVEYWEGEWEKRNLGFHMSSVNDFLLKYEPKLKRKSTIFVPLCGKSLDLAFLAKSGHNVVGLEGVSRAIKEFSEETMTLTEGDDSIWRSECGHLQIVNADLFTASIPNSPFEGVYDRGSITVFHPDFQEKYLEHMISLCAPKCDYLMWTLHFEKARPHPPYSTENAFMDKIFSFARFNLLSRKELCYEEAPFQHGSNCKIYWSYYQRS